ncbi:MAG: MBL fold metallo-hydrolase [Flavobacteriaceae bacterium]|nr:MBL fold metallo-hydrolase [Flavobacteriaceae bacterium]
MKFLKLSITALMVIMTSSCFGQNWSDVEIKTIQLSDHVYMLTGAGGNIGVSVGDDGVFVIDDQFAPLSAKIITAIKDLSDRPIHFLVNTHWHGDHTGGNANMSKEGVTIVAHDHVRKRLKETPKRDGSARETEALPVITYNDELNFFMNGERVAVFHVSNAHTDGDSVIFFTESNVLHTGDTYFNGRYPYIDIGSGGSVDGYISAVESSLKLIDDETKIIPGHGGVSNKSEFMAFLEMMKSLRIAVLSEIEKGKTEEEVAANTKITKAYDDLGYSWNFISSEKIRRAYYKSLKK